MAKKLDATCSQVCLKMKIRYQTWMHKSKTRYFRSVDLPNRAWQQTHLWSLISASWCDLTHMLQEKYIPVNWFFKKWYFADWMSIDTYKAAADQLPIITRISVHIYFSSLATKNFTAVQKRVLLSENSFVCLSDLSRHSLAIKSSCVFGQTIVHNFGVFWASNTPGSIDKIKGHNLCMNVSPFLHSFEYIGLYTCTNASNTFPHLQRTRLIGTKMHETFLFASASLQECLKKEQRCWSVFVFLMSLFASNKKHKQLLDQQLVQSGLKIKTCRRNVLKHFENLMPSQSIQNGISKAAPMNKGIACVS